MGGKKAFLLFIILYGFDLTYTKVNHHDMGREKAHLLTEKLNRGKLLFAPLQFNKPEGKDGRKCCFCTILLLMKIENIKESNDKKKCRNGLC